jgi:hypothetical protein
LLRHINYQGEIDMDKDNQQETVKDTELAWLAGFLDSDGSVQLTMPQANKACKKRVINVWVDFSNSDILIIEKATEILGKMGIPFHIATKHVKPIYKQDGGKFLPRKEICLAVRLGKLTSVLKLLGQLVEYMAGNKAAHSRIIMKYCEQRIPKGRTKYDMEDLIIAKEFFETRVDKVAQRNLLHLDGLLNDYTHGA